MATKSLRFENSFVDVHQKDLQNFMSYLMTESQEEFRFHDAHISVWAHLRMDEEDSLMTTVKIYFSASKTKISGATINQKWVYKSFRAKDFGCQNNSFTKID